MIEMSLVTFLFRKFFPTLCEKRPCVADFLRDSEKSGAYLLQHIKFIITIFVNNNIIVIVVTVILFCKVCQIYFSLVDLD